MTRLVGASAIAALLSAALVAAPAPARATGIIPASKVVKHAADYYGKDVTVKAKVDDVLGANMFTLDADTILPGPDVLVLVPGALAPVAKDQKVMVTGEVRPFVEPDLDRDFAFFQHGKIVEKQTKVDWKARPVIVARSVRTEDGTELVTPPPR